MENLNTFLESSTIHGLSYIATGRKYVRLFWILVVIGGFTGAGVIIYQSFQSWADSPVKTTIETLPITEITFPKVTVCPPKNTNTDLNYDLMMTENMTLDNDTRNELRDFAVEMLWDLSFNETMANLDKIKDKDRYLNWFKGFTEINLPHYDTEKGLQYDIKTSATSGNLSTQVSMDYRNVDKYFNYTITFYPPLKNNINKGNGKCHKLFSKKKFVGAFDC